MNLVEIARVELGNAAVVSAEIPSEQDRETLYSKGLNPSLLLPHIWEDRQGREVFAAIVRLDGELFPSLAVLPIVKRKTAAPKAKATRRKHR